MASFADYQYCICAVGGSEKFKIMLTQSMDGPLKLNWNLSLQKRKKSIVSSFECFAVGTFFKKDFFLIFALGTFVKKRQDSQSKGWQLTTTWPLSIEKIITLRMSIQRIRENLEKSKFCSISIFVVNLTFFSQFTLDFVSNHNL